MRGQVATVLAGVVLLTACSEATRSSEEPDPIVVPAEATPAIVREVGTTHFEVLTDDGCVYLRVTNLTDSIEKVDSICQGSAWTSSEPCVLYDTDGNGGGGAGLNSEEGPPCVSEVSNVAVWGSTALYDFIGYACVLRGGTARVEPIGPNGTILVVTEPGQTAEPAYLLSDGRADQGDTWGVPLNDDEAAACRAGAGLPEPALSPTFGEFQVRNAELFADEPSYVELATNTGWVWRGDPQYLRESLPAEAFADTESLRIRAFNDGESEPLREVEIPLGGEFRTLASSGSCFEVAIDASSGTVTSAEPCI